MKPEERANLRAGHLDDDLAGAILRNHHVAVGMTQNEQDLFRVSWQRQKFPNYSDHLIRLRNALKHLERGVPILHAFVEQKAASLQAVHVSSY